MQMQGMLSIGYPPAETVAPEKQARANQLEVDKSSKCPIPDQKSIYISLIGRCAHKNFNFTYFLLCKI